MTSLAVFSRILKLIIFGWVAQLVRAEDSYPSGRWFDPTPSYHCIMFRLFIKTIKCKYIKLFFILFLITSVHLLILCYQSFTNQHLLRQSSSRKKTLLFKKQSNSIVTSSSIQKNSITATSNSFSSSKSPQKNQENFNQYSNEISSLIRQYYHYPLISRKLKQSGMLIATIHLNSKGFIEQYHFDQPTEHEPLNLAFIDLMSKKIIYPKPPEELLENGILVIKLHLKLTLNR